MGGFYRVPDVWGGSIATISRWTAELDVKRPERVPLAREGNWGCLEGMLLRESWIKSIEQAVWRELVPLLGDGCLSLVPPQGQLLGLVDKESRKGGMGDDLQEVGIILDVPLIESQLQHSVD